MQSFVIKRGDTLPALRHVLDPATVDLSGAAVTALMRARNGASVALAGSTAVVIATGTPTVEYRWTTADTATAGLFEVEFQVTYPSGAVQTFPRVGYIQTRIEADITAAPPPISPPPAITAAPAITGSPFEGQTLTAVDASWSNGPILERERRWRAGLVLILGATGATFVPTAGEVGAAIIVEERALNAVGWSAWAASAATAPVAGLSQAAFQGSVTFTYSGPALTSFTSLDGGVALVVPDGGNVTITGVTPARLIGAPVLIDIDPTAAVNMQPQPHDLSGLRIDPVQGLQPFDQRMAVSAQYSGALNATLPAVMGPRQRLVKYVSVSESIPATVQDPRAGIASEIAVLNVVDQTQHAAMQADGGVATWVAPPPVTWAPRPNTNAGHRWRKFDMARLSSLRPGLDYTGISLPAGYTLATEVTRLNVYNPGILFNRSTSPPGGYEGHQIRNYWTTTGNYGERAAHTARYLAAHYLGNQTPWNQLEPAIRRMAVLGSWFYDAEKGRFDDAGIAGQAADGGHWQQMFIPMVLGLLATGRDADVANLFTVSPMNQGQMPRTLSAADVLQLAPHTNANWCYFSRLRPVIAIAGNTLNVTIDANDPTWCKFNQLECRRASDNSLVGYVRSMPGIRVPGNRNPEDVITLDRSVTGLAVNDGVYFAAPAGWPLAEGDAVWSIDGSMKFFSPSPQAEYYILNSYAPEVFFLRAMGLYSAGFEKLEKLVKTTVYTPELPSAEIAPLAGVAGATGFIKNHNPFGATGDTRATWHKAIWDAHAVNVGLGNTAPAAFNYELATLTQRGAAITTVKHLRFSVDNNVTWCLPGFGNCSGLTIGAGAGLKTLEVTGFASDAELTGFLMHHGIMPNAQSPGIGELDQFYARDTDLPEPILGGGRPAGLGIQTTKPNAPVGVT